MKPLRCNLCGVRPATYLNGVENHGEGIILRYPTRPGYGSLCLCSEHRAEYVAAETAYNRALYRLRRINFHQEM